MTSVRTADIISFASRATTAPMQNLRDLHAYWDRLRCGRALPNRSDIDPRDISHLLEHGFLLERVGSGDIRFRLAGMGIGDLMGMDVRGMPLRALINTDQRPEFSESLESIFDGPELHIYHLRSDRRGQDPLKAAMIVLPLLDSDGQISRALGTLVVEGRIGFAPRRFSMVERLRTPLADTSIREDVTRFEVPKPAPAMVMAEAQAEFIPAHPKAPFLRLVKS